MPYSRPWMTKRCRCSSAQPGCLARRKASRSAAGIARLRAWASRSSRCRCRSRPTARSSPTPPGRAGPQPPRPGEVVALDIDDLDLPRRRAVVIGKGGRAELIGWETRTARLLPRHLAGREQGPLFLTDLAPAPARQPCACRKSPPCRSSGMVVLVEDAAEPISSADVQPGEVVQIGDRFRQGLKGPSIGDALVWSVRVVERLVL